MKSYIKAILNIFRKKKIKYLGLTGLIYFGKDMEYFVGSELLTSKDYNIEIYKDDIYKYENGQKIKLDEVQSLKVFEDITKELEKTGMSVFPN